jgi:tetratricopeptide (TPR) repeat protein
MDDRPPETPNRLLDRICAATAANEPKSVSVPIEACPQSQACPPGGRAVVAAVCGLLCLAVILVFCQTAGYDFVNYDDDHYVYDNEHINRGFTWQGLLYYAYHWHAYTYHPLSTYSHMLDCQLFGLRAGGHHAMNVVLHAIVATLLFLLIRQMTGRLWPSAMVAALFAIHPLRVQSVAWIAERKDLLSGLFFVLTIGAYARYARAPWTARRYGAVCVLYVLGLLAKPMLVTLPMVLLVLDYWPLRRWTSLGQSEAAGDGDAEDDASIAPPEAAGGEAPRAESVASDAGKTLARSSLWHIPWHLIIEKIPFLLLSVADSALTVHTQVGAIQSLAVVSWSVRITNSLVAYVNYLGCFFWPKELAVLYPLPANGFSSGTAFAMFAVLMVLSLGVFLLRRQAPYLLVGWLWYLGMLVPVIGLLQVGGQSMADRYTYLPQIGLAIALVWAATDLIARFAARAGAAIRRACQVLSAFLAAGILAALAAAAWHETSYWRNSESLWVRDMTYANIITYYNLGLAVAKDGRHAEAVEHYQSALKIDPNDQDTHNNLGLSYEALGKLDEAAGQFRWILTEIQGAVDSKNKTAQELQQEGKLSEAKDLLREATEKQKESLDAHKNLARILHRQGKDREALEHWRAALQEDPKDVGVCVEIAGVLASSPDASLRDGPAALAAAQHAVDLSDEKDPVALEARAAAYAESGDFAQAIRDAQAARELSTDGRDDKLAMEIRDRLRLYYSGKPYHRGQSKGL